MFIENAICCHVLHSYAAHPADNLECMRQCRPWPSWHLIHFWLGNCWSEHRCDVIISPIITRFYCWQKARIRNILSVTVWFVSLTEFELNGEVMYIYSVDHCCQKLVAAAFASTSHIQYCQLSGLRREKTGRYNDGKVKCCVCAQRSGTECELWVSSQERSSSSLMNCLWWISSPPM